MEISPRARAKSPAVADSWILILAVLYDRENNNEKKALALSFRQDIYV